MHLTCTETLKAQKEVKSSITANTVYNLIVGPDCYIGSLIFSAEIGLLKINLYLHICSSICADNKTFYLRPEKMLGLVTKNCVIMSLVI